MRTDVTWSAAGKWLAIFACWAAMNACGSTESSRATPDAMNATGNEAASLDDAAPVANEGGAPPGDSAELPDVAVADRAMGDQREQGLADSGAASCRSDNDCGSSSYCRGVHDGPCVGTCPPAASCTADSQCDAGVCRETAIVPACATGGGLLVCSAPCQSDSDCPPADACTAGGHCTPRPCSTCPPYLNCVGGGVSGVCQAKSCQSDSDCAQGYCVKGSCQAALGNCEPRCG